MHIIVIILVRTGDNAYEILKSPSPSVVNAPEWETTMVVVVMEEVVEIPLLPLLLEPNSAILPGLHASIHACIQ